MLGKLLVVAEETSHLKDFEHLLVKKEKKIEMMKNAAEALEKFQSINPGLIIIDEARDWNPLQLGREMRKRTQVPIFILSSSLDKEEMVESFEAGINDYIVKPIDAAVLVAKVCANMSIGMELMKKKKEDRLKYKHLEIDKKNYTVKVRGKPIHLIAKELQILFKLVESPNKVYSAGQLYKQIWGVDSYGDVRTVMVHISNLRKKIERTPSNPEYIRTVRGFGYTFYQEEEPIHISE